MRRRLGVLSMSQEEEKRFAATQTPISAALVPGADVGPKGRAANAKNIVQ